MKTVDARGLTCPQPVLLTKKALEEGEKEFEVLVSSEIPKENVKKFCNNLNCEISETKVTDGWKLRVRCVDRENVQAKQEQEKTGMDFHPTFLLTCNQIGKNADLGKILMEGFINTLPSATKKPSRIFFMNEGVFLTTENSPALKALKKLEETGVELKSCGTCLDFYSLKDRLCVGTITNMYDIIEALTSGEEIVKI